MVRNKLYINIKISSFRISKNVFSVFTHVFLRKSASLLSFTSTLISREFELCSVQDSSVQSFLTPSRPPDEKFRVLDLASK